MGTLYFGYHGDRFVLLAIEDITEHTAIDTVWPILETVDKNSCLKLV